MPAKDSELGTRIVMEAFAVADIANLINRHPKDTAHGQLAALIAHTALNLDYVQEALLRSAQTAIEDLRRTVDGSGVNLARRDGLLQNTGAQIELLTTRRGVTVQHLNQLITASKRTLPSNDAEATRVRDQTHTAARSGPASRAVARTTLTAAQLRALEAVSSGGVTLVQFTGWDGASVHSGTDARITRATISALQAKGFAVRDTSASLYQGQALSLTPDGESALARAHRANAARTPSPGVRPSHQGSAAQHPESRPPAPPTTSPHAPRTH